MSKMSIMTSYDVTTSDFQKNLRNDNLDHNVYVNKIWSQMDEQEGNGGWTKYGPKNGIMTLDFFDFSWKFISCLMFI